MPDNKTHKYIKGMDSKMRCKGFQYKEGETYKIPEEDVSICNKGFHAIDEDECPLSVFDYYPPCNECGTPNRFFEVEIGGKTEKEGEKICGSEIKIGAEIDFLGLAKAHVEWVKKHIKKDGEKHETEDMSSASNTGNMSSASNTGDMSSASNTGDMSSASNTGNMSSASNTGNMSSASNTGYRSSASNTGYRSSASNTGDMSSASNTGNRSSAEVSGKESIVAVFGKDSKARGALGCWLVLTERGAWDGEGYPIKEVRSVKVDGETIKPMVWYKLEDGEIKEVED